MRYALAVVLAMILAMLPGGESFLFAQEPAQAGPA